MDLRLDYDELRVLGALVGNGQFAVHECRRLDDQTLALRLALDLQAVTGLLAGHTAVATVHLHLSLLDADTLALRLAAFHLDAAPLALLLRPVLESTIVHTLVWSRLKPRPGLVINRERHTLHLAINHLLPAKLQPHRLRLQHLQLTPAGLELTLSLSPGAVAGTAPGNPASAPVSHTD